MISYRYLIEPACGDEHARWVDIALVQLAPYLLSVDPHVLSGNHVPYVDPLVLPCSHCELVGCIHSQPVDGTI